MGWANSTRSRLRARQPGAHRPHWHGERGCDLFVAELTPGVEQQRVALRRLQCRQRLCQSRVAAVPHVIRDVLRQMLWLAIESRLCFQQTLFGAPVVAQQIGRDPQQPRQRPLDSGIKVQPTLKRHREAQRGEIVGLMTSGTAREMAVDRSEMAIKDRGENVWSLD